MAQVNAALPKVKHAGPSTIIGLSDRPQRLFLGPLFLSEPDGNTNIVGTTALFRQVAMNGARLLAELQHTVRQSGEASERLQRAANRFNFTAVLLTVFLSIVAVLQAAHIIKTW